MKNVIVTLSVLIIWLFAFTCCSDETPLTTIESATQMLGTQAWKIQNVTIDDVDRTSSFSGLTLEFSSQEYTTTNGHVVWPESGEWSFTNDTAKTILRSDGVVITVDQISDHALILSLNWDQNTLSGRINSIKGHHKFTFAK
jgi:hypothetical protein